MNRKDYQKPYVRVVPLRSRIRILDNTGNQGGNEVHARSLYNYDDE